MKPEKAMEPSGRELPGFRKKSFALPYRSGMIWFEHLDGLGRFCQGADSKVRRELSRRWAPFGMTEAIFRPTRGTAAGQSPVRPAGRRRNGSEAPPAHLAADASPVRRAHRLPRPDG